MLATGLFLDEIWRFNGWALEFLDALHYTGFSDIAKTLEPGKIKVLLKLILACYNVIFFVV